MASEKIKFGEESSATSHGCVPGERTSLPTRCATRYFATMAGYATVTTKFLLLDLYRKQGEIIHETFS